MSIAVSDLPPSQTATLRITTASALAESGRVARVHFTMGYISFESEVEVETTRKLMITLPPLAEVVRPLSLTVTANFWDGGQRGLVVRVSRNAIFPVGSFTNFPDRVRVFTITVTEGSEEIQSTLYAQADIPFVDMPGFSLPSFPQMPKLAFADPVILVRWAGIQHNRVAIIQKPRS